MGLNRLAVPHARRAGVESRFEVVKSPKLFQAASRRLGLKSTRFGLCYCVLCYVMLCILLFLLVRNKHINSEKSAAILDNKHFIVAV